MADSDRHLTLTEAAALLGISTDAARKRAERGRLPGAYKVRTRWWVPLSAIVGQSENGHETEVGRTAIGQMQDLTDLVAALERQNALLERIAAAVERPPMLPVPVSVRQPDRWRWWRWLVRVGVIP